MKNKVVVFNENGIGAKVLINPPNIGELEGKSNVRVNPDLSSVKNISPEDWLLNPHNVIVRKDHPNADIIETVYVPAKDKEQDEQIMHLERRVRYIRKILWGVLALSVLNAAAIVYQLIGV